ncbi:hypothetical protein E5676_scaffold409G00710 [Cucumis melo var. makuwa]|uniref:Uncharacterized protein n=1 Tax=Cucumis melo var. makuwa TaxID=1194695 RepID=A0A5D3BZ74_CUCMM|nr:hypothetical protein E6C27_scaffold139G004180 [Cucumis melo var. makuwa]TYK04465.1 hypothetical protein E5676_scaffold409G00710 [Cucumis melo var. makuwa]
MAATLEEEIKEHKDDSDSSKSDRHWKRPLKKAKVSGDDPDKKRLKCFGIDSTIEGVGTSKTPVSKPAEQSLRPSSLLEEIYRSKMTVGVLHPKEMPALKNPYRRSARDMLPLNKIMQTPFEYVPRLIPEIATVLSGIEKIHADSLTPLEEYLNSYLKRVDNFNDVQSSYSAQLLSIDKARQLDEKTSAIEETLTLMEQLRGDAKVIQERATQLSLEKKELERKLQSINAESEQLSILFCEKTKIIDQQELEVVKLQDEVNTLEGTPAITE